MKKIQFIPVIILLFTFGLTNAQNNKSLPEAIKQGEFKTFKVLISQVEDLNQPMKNGYTPLIYSVKYNQKAIVSYLIEKGADIEEPANGKTPLMYAAKYNRIELLKLLIDKGANVNNSTYKGNALYYAKKYERDKVIDILKHHDAEIKQPKAFRGKNYELNGCDGPYVFHDEEDQTSLVLSVDKENQLKMSKEKELEKVEVISKGGISFQVPLKSEKKEESMSVWDQPEQIFAMSDIEGNFQSFISTLQNNQVIDKQLTWSFGDGHLVLNGDFADRGSQVRPVLWLIYKLEAEAEKQGGKVHFILGNHELMNLQGDMRYNADKYKALAQKLKLSEKGLFVKETELGGWLRTKNVAEKIGDHLFVHGGISEQVLKSELTIPEINQVARENYDKSQTDLSDNAKLLFGRYGPLWYRGLVRDYKYYEKLQESSVDEILGFYKAKDIIVGHNIVEDISTDYHGKVIRIDVDHSGNSGKALLIKHDQKLKAHNSVDPLSL